MPPPEGKKLRCSLAAAAVPALWGGKYIFPPPNVGRMLCMRAEPKVRQHLGGGNISRHLTYSVY